MVSTRWMYLLLLQNAVTFITGFVLAAAQCNNFALCIFLSLRFCLYCFFALLFLSALIWTCSVCLHLQLVIFQIPWCWQIQTTLLPFLGGKFVTWAIDKNKQQAMIASLDTLAPAKYLDLLSSKDNESLIEHSNLFCKQRENVRNFQVEFPFFSHCCFHWLKWQTSLAADYKL